IAGLWRTTDVGEAFTMLTTEPGPDVAPYHHRQVAVLAHESWGAWLDGSGSALDLLGPCPAGMLEATRAG
ncbi:MAG TPA: SOS response-associated peptidase family protein, partial [Allosphingosinicella sp.]|nr:SOS response-associated peptidase family protein [Allosphingosinicella sp.]